MQNVRVKATVRDTCCRLQMCADCFIIYCMRIDKFLKVSRVIKRRTVAQEACDGGRIEINGKAVKPSKEVKVGDVVTVSFGNRAMRFEVLSVDERQTKQSAETMYRILSEPENG